MILVNNDNCFSYVLFFYLWFCCVYRVLLIVFGISFMFNKCFIYKYII